MTINDQVRDEKLQYNINREAAKISALSSCKIYKHEYLTGQDILPRNQQQLIEQAKFTYSPLGKAFEKQVKTIEEQGQKQVDAFEKQIKTIEDQGQKQVEVLKDLKRNKINNKSEEKNSPPISTIIFNDLISERKKIMSELYDSVDFNNLNFEYVGPTEDVRFSGYMDSKELFNKIKNNRIKFSEVKNKQNDFLKKLNEVKIGKKN